MLENGFHEAAAWVGVPAALAVGSACSVRRCRGNTSDDICRLEGIGFLHPKKKLSLLFLSTLHHFAVPGELDLLSALSSTQLLGFFRD